MNGFWTLWKREVGSYFLSPIAYITTVFFLVVMGFSFWFMVNLKLISGAMAHEITREIYASFFTWIAVLIVIPLITMRCFSEEHKSGTIETLMTAPVTDLSVVLAKYLGTLFFYVVMWMPTASYIFIVNQFSTTPFQLDPGALAGSYVGGLMVGGLFIAFGILCSSMTSNQIASAIMTFAIVTVLFFSGFLPYISDSNLIREITTHTSSVMHMLDASRGIIDSRSIVFYLSSITLVLFATVKVVEARKWK